jgi:cytochrome c553
MNRMMMIAVTAAVMVWMAAPLGAAEVKEVYDKSCAACHGKTGKGDTPAGKKAKVKDYTDAQVQAAMKDEEMFKAIKEGVKEGDKVKMKGYGDKLSDDEIKALVAYIRTLKK